MYESQSSPVGQALMGGQQQTPPQQDPQGNAPLADRMQQFQGPQQQQPQQQAPPQQKQPTPEEADQVHHQALGRFAHMIMGNQRQYSVDPNTGKTVETTVPTKPGQWARSLVLGALIGAAAGASGGGGGGKVGSALAGAGRGAGAVADANQAKDQRAQAQAQQQFKNQQEAQKNNREETAATTEEQMKRAMIAHENIETLRTQQLINGDALHRYETEAENGRTKSQVYIESG